MVATPRPRAGTASEDGATEAEDRPDGLSDNKPRSCVTCRSRKVRCDKMSPCSNCRRARIPCVFPSSDKIPRWAHRIERANTNANTPADSSSGVGHVLNRLRSLEGLVKELGGQLGQMQADSSGPPTTNHERAARASRPHSQPKRQRQAESESPAVETTPTQSTRQFGRLVTDGTSQSRYVSTGFWTRVNDELNALKVDTQALAAEPDKPSDEEDHQQRHQGTSSTLELERTPLERNAFLFRHSLGSTPDIRHLHPLPSQIPFILNIFSDNLNSMSQVVHMPTLNKMIRNVPGGSLSALPPSQEALIFSIYYSSITSMEDDDVLSSFGSTKADLNLRFRVGFEHALSKADFLNAPNVTLVQALAIFLMLARRHDSPRYVWMLVGLLVRMAQALGLQRDGSQFSHLTPFETEMRRRIWWGVCIMDLRSSEDQAMDLTIAEGSFDTRLPMNINLSDLDPHTKEFPEEREGLTDMTLPLVWYTQVKVMRQMVALMSRKDGPSTFDEQVRLLDEIEDSMDRLYLRYITPSGNPAYWVAMGVRRVVVAKMTLFIYLPRLFSSPTHDASDAIHTKLLISAIEIAEFNQALNSADQYRPWRWIFQTYTHWHAIVYLLITAAKQPWSPMVERAWVAVHGGWLIPKQHGDKLNLRTWVPLRKLMAKARRHRETELKRLRDDSSAVQELHDEDKQLPQPKSPGMGPYPGEVDNIADLYRQRWLRLVSASVGSDDAAVTTQSGGGAANVSQGHPASTTQANTHTSAQLTRHDFSIPGSTFTTPSSADATAYAGHVAQDLTNTAEPIPSTQMNWADDLFLGKEFSSWHGFGVSDEFLHPIAGDESLPDMGMDVDSNMDWGEWIQYAQGTERNDQPLAMGMEGLV